MNKLKLSILTLALTIFSTSAFSQVRPGQRDRLRQQNRNNQRVNPGAVDRRSSQGRIRQSQPTRVRRSTRQRQVSRSNYRARTHRSYNHNYVQRRRYLRTVNYYNQRIRNNRNYVRNNWIFYPQNYTDGYYVIEQYPYFIYNGYRHRYSMSDSCDYQLIDSHSNRAIENYYGMCARSYDNCATERDWKNNYEYSNRYICAETFRHSPSNY